MELNELLKGVETRAVRGDATIDVIGIRYDSRDVTPGSLFVAVKGEQFDGNRFVRQAVDHGAVAIVSESPDPGPDAVGAVWVRVASDRRALSALASRFFERPTSCMRLVGITGTNGKTTTAHIVESVLSAGGSPVAILGTIGYRFGGALVPAERTTPEAVDLERMFADALAAGCRDAVMEVSSHALALHRVDALDFDVAVFTNLSGDHLDFHGDMETYFESKRRLFTGPAGTPPSVAVINRDDDRWEVLSKSGNARTVSYGMTPAAEVHPVRVAVSRSGIEAEVRTRSGNLSLKSRLLGGPNLYNLCAAVAVGEGLEIPADQIAAGIEAMAPVPGRFESVDCGQAFRVFVDYAHTDDALAKVLDAARELTTRRLIVVFGAGGGRDRTKRPRMGEAAGARADLTVVTSDNPRDEDPLGIIADIEVGLRASGGDFIAIPDRRDAIREALGAARPGDVVVLAGKGHERYQAIGGEKLPFDDHEVARELLGDRNGSHA